MLIHMDSCDFYPSASPTFRWDTTSGVNTTSMQTGGRFGGGAIAFASSDSSFVSKSVANLATVIMAGAYRNDGSAATRLFDVFNSSAASQFNVQKDASGFINLRRGATVVATSTQTLGASTATWHWIECKLTVDPTAGYCEVRVNGQVWVTFTGNTRNTAVAGIAQARFYGQGRWDDLVVMDSTGATNADFIGDCRITTLAPTSDESAGFTRSGGASNFDMVDDAQADGDSTYVETSTAAARDVYGMADLTSNPSVKAVVAVAMSRKDDAGARSLKVGVRHGTSETQAESALLTSYGYQTCVSETNPATGLAWTATEVNAARLTLECV